MSDKNLGNIFWIITEQCVKSSFATDKSSAIENIAKNLDIFFKIFTKKDYYESCRINFDLINCSEITLPALIILDYYIDSSDPFEISFKQNNLAWPDYLLLGYYYDNITEDYLRGNNLVIDYVLDEVLSPSLENLTSEEQMTLSTGVNIIARYCKLNKLWNVSNSFIRKDVLNMTNIMTRTDDIKDAVSVPLASYIRETYPLVDIETVAQTDIDSTLSYKLGQVTINGISCVVKNGTLGIEYVLNDVKRRFAIEVDKYGNTEEYLYYTDMLAYVLALKWTVGLDCESIKAITRKYSLMMFRAVPITDEDTYSEFLSLTE
jgi:hypothetical protein